MNEDIFELGELTKKIVFFIRKEKNPFVDFFFAYDSLIDYNVESRINVVENILMKLADHAVKNTSAGYIAMTVKQLERGSFNSMIEFAIAYTGIEKIENGMLGALPVIEPQNACNKRITASEMYSINDLAEKNIWFCGL